MLLDLKISAGTIVDGTGAARFVGDVGVRDGRIIELGKISTPARRTIDADGALVTPGFVDMHTHYDAQVLWDGDLLASSRHGVTTAVMVIVVLDAHRLPTPSRSLSRRFSKALRTSRVTLSTLR